MYGLLKYGFCKVSLWKKMQFWIVEHFFLQRKVPVVKACCIHRYIPLCEEKSVQLFRVAFFRSDFFKNPYFRLHWNKAKMEWDQNGIPNAFEIISEHFLNLMSCVHRCTVVGPSTSTRSLVSLLVASRTYEHMFRIEISPRTLESKVSAVHSRSIFWQSGFPQIT